LSKSLTRAAIPTTAHHQDIIGKSKDEEEMFFLPQFFAAMRVIKKKSRMSIVNLNIEANRQKPRGAKRNRAEVQRAGAGVNTIDPRQRLASTAQGSVQLPICRNAVIILVSRRKPGHSLLFEGITLCSSY
jgi:hypothetical protein